MEDYNCIRKIDAETEKEMAISNGTGIVLKLFNNKMRKRRMELAEAYETVDKKYKEYRNRVIDRFGKEVDAK